MKLSKEEYQDSVRLGVRDAILELTENVGIIRTEQFMESIRSGVYDAIWSIATNATHMPCNDFYDMIKNGVKEGIESMGDSPLIDKYLKDLQCRENE